MAWQTTACRVFLVVAMTVLVGELQNVTGRAGNQWPSLSDADLDKMWGQFTLSASLGALRLLSI